VTLLAVAATRAAGAPAVPATQLDREADDCVGDLDILSGATDEEDGDEDDEDVDEDEDDDGHAADRCHGAFEYLDELELGADSRSFAAGGDEPHEVVPFGAGDASATRPFEEWAAVVPSNALEPDEVTAGYEQLLHDPDVVASLDAADAALVEDPLVREAIETGSAFASTSFADASELEDVALRHHRPSRWGRFDLTIAWRRTWTSPPVAISLGPLPHGPIAQSYDTADHLLVMATWSH
jgi:hypothetical protein